VDNRPSGYAVIRGALLRQRRPDSWVFQLMFLDEGNQPVRDPVTGRVLGRTVFARDCDEELHELFGARDLILSTDRRHPWLN